MAFYDGLKTNKNYQIALAATVIIGLWLGSGLISPQAPSEPAAVTPSSVAEKKSSVRARYIDATAYQATLTVSGRTEANRSVDVKAQIGGQVIATPTDKGALVKQGDVICELDPEDRALRVAEAKAKVDKAQIEYDGALRLKTGGFQSKVAIASSKADLDSAKANLQAAKLNLDRLSIRAPFDGIVDQRPAEIGDLMQRGESCATVIDLNPLLVSARLSATEVASLQQGTPVTANLMTGQQVSGSISFIGKDSDQLTRTFPIEVSVENTDYQLVSGISAQLAIPTATVPAHLIPSSLIALDDDGRIGVRILDSNNRVEFRRVEVVGDEPKGLWVAGLPDRSLLITVGQEYVSNGQIVQVALEKPESLAETVKPEATSKGDAQL